MMSRFIDCRNYPSRNVHFTVAISADTKDELIEAVVQHGTKVHDYEDTLEFRENIKTELKRDPPLPNTFMCFLCQPCD
ncbi:MAG: DUF1059 domain-containing protein [Desulfobacterales bacterium]|nr:DUF1059 domain-containing protein [Desulfobacterales bacterium]